MRLALPLAIALLAAAPALAQNSTATPNDDAASSGAATQDRTAQQPQPANGASQNPSSSVAAAAVLVPIDNDDAPVPSLNLMVSQVEDMDVIGSDGQTIGEVEDVLGDAEGNAAAVTVEAGGFLGLGSKRVILMADDLQLQMGRLQTSLTRDQISSLPEYQN